MIHIYKDLEDISQAAAEIFIDAAKQAITVRGCFSVAISGGNTPHRLYEILASALSQDLIKWQSVHVFWGDERCVPIDDPRSNYRMARETLLDHIPLPRENIHPMQGSLPPAEAAGQYEIELRNYFKDQTPAMDMILLGLGGNAHTASLFPYTPALNENVRWVTDVYVAEQDMHRITLTARFINQADQVFFLVSGADKAAALHNVLEGAYQPHIYPAQLIHPNGAHPTWLVDKAASHKLTMEIEEQV